jgi:hypothetical protein
MVGCQARNANIFSFLPPGARRILGGIQKEKKVSVETKQQQSGSKGSC